MYRFMYTVTQNASFLTGASVVQKVISFVYFILVARFLGVEQTGAYFFAITFTTIFSVLADAGLGPVLTREVAKTPERAGELLPTVLWSKIGLGIVTYTLVVVAVNALNYSITIRQLVYVSGLTMVFDNLQTVFFSILRAHKNLFYEAVGVIFAQLITLSIGTMALFNQWPLVWLILAYTIPSACNMVFAATVVRRKFHLAFFVGAKRTVLKMLFLLAWPFAVASFIGRLYSYTDTVLISKLLSAHDLGWWGLARKIVTAFQFVPIALTASVYPAMSTWFITDKAKVGELFEKSWRYLFLVLFPVAFGIGALATPIIRSVYGVEFLPAAPVLQILLGSILFGFLALVTGATFNATGNQRVQTVILAGGLTFNILFNLILIPRFGIQGAAVAELISNICLWTAGFYLLRKKVLISYRTVLTYFNQAFWPALIMGVVVYLSTSRVHWLLAIPLGGVVYVGMLFVSGVVTKDLVAENIKKISVIARKKPHGD